MENPSICNGLNLIWYPLTSYIMDDRIYSNVTCSICNETKQRTQVGMSPNRSRKYYADENGRKWKGKKCPDCLTGEYREHMRQYRKKSTPAKDPLWDLEVNTSPDQKE